MLWLAGKHISLFFHQWILLAEQTRAQLGILQHMYYGQFFLEVAAVLQTPPLILY